MLESSPVRHDLLDGSGPRPAHGVYRPCDRRSVDRGRGRRRHDGAVPDVGYEVTGRRHGIGSDPGRGTTTDRRARRGGPVRHRRGSDARRRRPFELRPRRRGGRCGGPMEQGGDSVSPQHPPVARLSPAFPSAREFGVAARIDNDASAGSCRAGWGGAGQSGLPCDGGVHRCRQGSCSPAGCSTGRSATPATSVTSSSTRPAGNVSVVRVPGGPGLGPVDRGVDGSAGSRRRSRTKRWAGRLVGRAVASVANLLDLRLAVVAGSVALGFGEPFFTAARKSRPLGLPRLLAVPESFRRAVAAARSSGRRRSDSRSSAERTESRPRTGMPPGTILAVLRHPDVWWVAVRQAGRMAGRGWWRRAPPCPSPIPTTSGSGW